MIFTSSNSQTFPCLMGEINLGNLQHHALNAFSHYSVKFLTASVIHGQRKNKINLEEILRFSSIPSFPQRSKFPIQPFSSVKARQKFTNHSVASLGAQIRFVLYAFARLISSFITRFACRIGSCLRSF